MEAELYRALSRFVLQVPHPRRPRVAFGDRLIVLVALWAALHQRPTCWACDGRNWPPRRAHALPSCATMSRRARTVGVQQLLARVLARLGDLFPDTLVKQLDAKPLVVGSYSTDRDATRGRVGGAGGGRQIARGYKLHALGDGRAIRYWTLSGMNVNDQVPAAVELLPRLAHGGGGGYVAADNGFDANRVHAAAAAANHQLVAPPRRSNRHVRDARRNRPERLRALDLCDNPLRACGVRRWFGGDIMRERVAIERTLSQLTFAGLYALPPWVRRPHRVATWVACKLIIWLYKSARNAGLTA